MHAPVCLVPAIVRRNARGKQRWLQRRSGFGVPREVSPQYFNRAVQLLGF